MKELEKIKKNVLDLTAGMEKEDRKFALDFLRKHVRMDELHQEAVDLFSRKEVVFGSGSKTPLIVVITKTPIQPDAKARLLNAFNKMGVEDIEIYFATNNFVATRRYKDERTGFLIRLLEILKPKIIVSFDGIDYSDELQIKYINTSLPSEAILDKENKDNVARLNQQFRTIKNKISTL